MQTPVWLDWNIYALAATVEEARHNDKNPAVPEWLLADYERAWLTLETMALAHFPAAESTELIDSLVATLALAKKRLRLGRMAMLTEDEREEMLDTADWA